ncbi:pro-sigmaK processing inhibitor BofA family protein [Chakrabartyella piscis]|uniref:pro-sigmaK processing inhibitor BofA family protein n=1 Tax=Chakrabartyella piscis TaxID=2918914 RepID=UPI00295843E8|nr:pro-sigmaK processing inhibitor BofA family protein [Chakrabartyella piscis]
MTYVLPTLIGGCLIFLLLATQKNTIKSILGFGVSALVGSGCLLVANQIGFALGLNLYTCLTVGILGIPGFLGLLALSIFL